VPSALDVVDGEVRELIRRRGLDPFTDPAPVRLLVRDVVADYSERSLTSALPPIGDPESVVRDVLDGWPASLRCSATSTAPRSRRSGSTNSLP
jgi:pilus assembly protein CpaF